jgi:hypothetical protein
LEPPLDAGGVFKRAYKMPQILREKMYLGSRWRRLCSKKGGRQNSWKEAIQCVCKNTKFPSESGD